MPNRPITILLAEDNPSDAELTLHSLSDRVPADQIQLAADGVEALDFLFCRDQFAERSFDNPPSLVLLDIKLPKIDGLEVLRAVKEDSRTRAIPVVLLTSSKIERDIVRGYCFGANSYVQKPVDFAEFRVTIRSVADYWLGISQRVPAAAFRVKEL